MVGNVEFVFSMGVVVVSFFLRKRNRERGLFYLLGVEELVDIYVSGLVLQVMFFLLIFYYLGVGIRSYFFDDDFF